ncbi:447L [Invertebrate iridescent virus Kaz2018]|uniref:447L n=1 Tax=Invertebrate iridescent virus 6 TaxID=176652 RepID=Q91F79_IIV6|nr:447L [Invertebrate iridescent virus 6]AAK82307.1 447L [Invertebrate iridescent virus 6]QNH08857.1 447L [Invertebrate iridescent virus Kaz2018]
MAPAATVGAVATLPVKSPNISIPPRVEEVAAEILNTVLVICSPEPNVRFVGADVVLLEPII